MNITQPTFFLSLSLLLFVIAFENFPGFYHGRTLPDRQLCNGEQRRTQRDATLSLKDKIKAQKL